MSNREVTKYINRAFFSSFRARFDEHLGKFFAAGRWNGVVVVVAKDGSTKARDLEHLVEDDWGGYFDGENR